MRLDDEGRWAPEWDMTHAETRVLAEPEWEASYPDGACGGCDVSWSDGELWCFTHDSPPHKPQRKEQT